MALFRPSPETFVVEEIPAYEPSGSGEHTFVWIEKRDLTTDEAVRRLAQALGIQARDVGYAGKKDRHATTRQWLSLPRVAPDSALAAVVPGLQVKQAALHGNKLRMGHAHGNRFDVTLVDVSDADAARIQAAFDDLIAHGMTNVFGQQRFGMRGDNVSVALEVLRGTRRERDSRRRKFLYSALQSEVFNRVAELRTRDGLLRTVIEGDVLQKTTTGGIFVTDAPAVDQARLDAGELVVTGPLPGTRVTAPPPGTAAAAIEEAAAQAVGLAEADLVRGARDMPGTRRRLVVPVTEAELTPGTRAGTPAGTLSLRFALPAGSYATVLVEALGVQFVAGGPDQKE